MLSNTASILLSDITDINTFNGINTTGSVTYVSGQYVQLVVKYSDSVSVSGNPSLSLFYNSSTGKTSYVTLFYTRSLSGSELLFSPLFSTVFSDSPGMLSISSTVINLNGGNILKKSDFLSVVAVSLYLNISNLNTKTAIVLSYVPYVLSVRSPGYTVHDVNNGIVQSIIVLVEFNEPVQGETVLTIC